MPLNYTDYLKLPELLDLQEPKSKPEQQDELLFIVIHQVYELWFKLMLHEVDKVKRDFSKGDIFGAIHTFKRLRTVMKTLVGQLDILETMTPISFTSFRDRLESASGFQSTQFREVEFVFGYKRAETLKYYDPSNPALATIQRRLNERTVIDHFHDFLALQGIEIPAEVRERDVTLAAEPNEAVQEGILQLYRTRGECEILFEVMTDFDEGMQEWRYRHVKIVERTIGSKQGTGGSPGVEFLKRSLFRPLFADLWAIRHRM